MSDYDFALWWFALLLGGSFLFWLAARLTGTTLKDHEDREDQHK